MTDVLIAGAGPTGLMLALWLTRQGVRVRIVDRRAGPGDSSRAMAVQARTLELYRQLDLADAVVAAGQRNPAVNLWARGRRRARIALGDAGAGVTPYPFVLIYPQDRHERLLIERLHAMGVAVERGTEVLELDESDGRVVARLRLPDGREEHCEARYVAGCDGAGSTVRKQLGVGFEGGTYRQLFYVADVELSGIDPPGEVHVALGADFVAALAYGDDGQFRLVGAVDEPDQGAPPTFDDVSRDAMDRLGVTVDAVHWFSTYRVHHRVAETFQRGRVLLLGDAAHVHSPAGGQGMNTGILDAINLAWKIAAVLSGRAPARLLDSYGEERRTFARTLVATTDRVFTFVTAQGGLANAVRTWVAPGVAGVAQRIGNVRELFFRTVSQTTLHYRGSALSEGRAGDVEGGDRLPWVRAADGDNHAPLADIGWQVHVYGEARPELRAWCQARGVALHVFAWAREHARAGLARDAAYLLRPDTWVALADPAASPAALEGWFASRGVDPRGAPAA